MHLTGERVKHARWPLLAGLALAALATVPARAHAIEPAAFLPVATDAATKPGVKRFTLVAVQIGQSKFWLPSTIVVRQGDQVVLTLKNKIPGDSDRHGFALPAYHVDAVITRGQPKTVSFVASREGVYPYLCDPHAQHVGGRLIVEPRM